MNSTSTQTSLLTEKAALASLATWAEKRPAWQRDALRRLITSGTLDDQGVTAIFPQTAVQLIVQVLSDVCRRAAA